MQNLNLQQNPCFVAITKFMQLKIDECTWGSTWIKLTLIKPQFNCKDVFQMHFFNLVMMIVLNVMPCLFTESFGSFRFGSYR